MRLAFLGTGGFAVPALRALWTSGHEAALIVVRPPKGRRGEPPAPMRIAAEELGAPVWLPESVNLPESQQRLRDLEADLLIVCDYGEILRRETLATTRLGGINLHGSLLPKYRGAAPVQWAILRGEIETGNTVIQMTSGLDAGPCLGQQQVEIDPDETAGELESRLAELGAQLMLQVVDQLAAGTTQPVAQHKTAATKAPRLAKEDGAIDWSQTAAKIKNQVRALQPWPRTFTFLQRGTGEPVRLSIDRVRTEGESGGPSGTVLAVGERLVVATGEGALEILELQPAGKRRMAAAEFLRGNPVKVGDRLS
ncbi:MAG: methionyl-tRNA formyltransferase [Pirellulales bacterium]